ncbi:hypothetical protein CMK11_12790, partial [Candidatus Poribacteria bacterium]|nr:hypothetical protein [Candidatus Poribacteria bacterium]
MNTPSNVPKRDAETGVVDRLLANYRVTIVDWARWAMRAHGSTWPDAPSILLPTQYARNPRCCLQVMLLVRRGRLTAATPAAGNDAGPCSHARFLVAMLRRNDTLWRVG